MRPLKLLTVLPASLLLGCAAGHDRTDLFPTQSSGGRAAIEDVYDTYTDAGAAADGHLYAGHFDGGRLTAAGREKLDAMIRHGGDAVTVYADLPPDDARLGERLDAARGYLGRNVPRGTSYSVERGRNPAGRPAEEIKPQPVRVSA